MFKRLKIGHKLFLGFGIITLLLLSVVGYSYTNFIRQSQYADVNLHSNNVIRESDALLISLINMETGARGFALTGKEEFLEPFNQGKQDYEKSYNKLLQLTSNDVNQQIRLSNVNNQFQTWLKFETTEIIDARRKVNAGQLKMEDVIAVAQTGKGKEQFDALRSILNSITNEEQELLKVRQDNLARMKSQTTVLLFIGGLISVALASLISFLVIRMILQPITTVTNTFREISEGEADLEIRLKVNSNDELGNMSKYFNTFMGKLKELISENKNQSWLKTGEAELNEKIRGEQGISALSENIINYVSKYLNIQIGALYTRAEEDCFKLSGSYAYSKQDEEDRKIKIGEGVLGQAALEKQIIVINDVPEGYIKVTSALGERKPNSIIAVPLVHNNEIQGIMELGTFHNLESIEMKFINQISIVIAHTLYSAKVRDKMNELLSKTIEQSEELQTQQEELRQNNEELEEQAKALLESEAYLQRQQEELRVANEELQDYAKNLELQKKDIADKNESLKNAQIEIKEKADALELSNKYKSEFLANMSHELRTPLNSILVLSQILMEKKDNSPMSSKELEFAKTIYSSGSDLLKLINDILDLSKVEVGKLDINFEELKIAELANYADRTFSAVAAKKGLYFNFEIQPGLPESIISDGQRVQQIVNNLISNAIKFTSTGGVTIGFHDVKDKNLIEISIADTGIGIPLHKQ